MGSCCSKTIVSYTLCGVKSDYLGVKKLNQLCMGEWPCNTKEQTTIKVNMNKLRKLLNMLYMLSWGSQVSAKLLFSASWGFFWIGQYELSIIFLILGLFLAWTVFAWDKSSFGLSLIALYALWGLGEASLCGAVVSAFIEASRGQELGFVMMAQLGVGGLLSAFSMGKVVSRNNKPEPVAVCDVCNGHAWGDTENEDGSKGSLPCPTCNKDGLIRDNTGSK